jgi:hypothetical protein
MASMRRDDIIWTLVITLIAVAINPVLKSIGLLPADVFRNLGIAFPGQPQIVFGPLMAFLLLVSQDWQGDGISSGRNTTRTITVLRLSGQHRTQRDSACRHRRGWRCDAGAE